MPTIYFETREATRVTFKNAEKLLARLVINDAKKLLCGEAIRTALLSANGGVLGAAILLHTKEDTYEILLTEENAAQLEAWIRQMQNAFDAEVSVEKTPWLPLLGLEGLPARGKVNVNDQVTTFNLGWIAGIVGQSEALNHIREALIKAEAIKAEEAQFDAMRILAREGAYGLEYDESTNACEAGFESRLDFTDESRVFVGRALTQARVASGKYDRLNLVAFSHAFDPGTLLEVPLVIVGDFGYQLTSITRIPDMNLTVGLVRLPASVKEGDQLRAQIKTNPPTSETGVLVIAPQA